MRRIRRKLPLIIILVFSTLVLLSIFKSVTHHVCSGTARALGLCRSGVNSQDWKLFYHLGGNGPWIPKSHNVAYDQAPLPKGCSVDQVHMLSRHAERYPTKTAGARHLELLKRLDDPTVSLEGSLSFVKSWTYFTDPTDPAFENLTQTGPYAGTLQASNTGKTLRDRYQHLLPRHQSTRFWSCGSPRDIETAKHFASGFFGANWLSDGTAELQVIPEDPKRGGDTLTPGDTCYKYDRDGYSGHDAGYRKLDEWQTVFTQPIIKRLASLATGIELEPVDVYSMMEMCGFEILVRGSSPWCAVFSQDEWLDFEYARDLLHFYRAGPGNPYAGAMGWLWLNATRTLMLDGRAQHPYMSFVHDGDIVPVLATLKVFDERLMQQTLPSDKIKSDRNWRTSDVVPMGGRLILERIVCDALVPASSTSKDYFVRLFINDGLIRLPGLPKMSRILHAVNISDFSDFVRTRQDVFGEFRAVCSLPDNAPDRITFLHQD
ncbi:hypothetical protein B0A52_06938 [Exophiala mesophila]|uniref:3-phytase n=1 Tax=Exophiala mesophila TaxID=212818 RepID=A0A438N1A8_EXOME|nr:hypothetical protein B0A52_06938 [Exophiala mesophila]